LDLSLALVLPLLEFTDNGLKYIGAGLAIGVGSIGPALAIGMLAAKAMEGIGRNPEAQPQIQSSMILAIVFAEAVAIYALVVAIMIGFIF
jgi:F-type H+-transporting ATPase subunit c